MPMNPKFHCPAASAVCAAAILTFPTLAAAEPDPAAVTAALKRSADWQLANPSRIENRDWVIAPLYDGLLRLSTTTGDPQYLAALIGFGNQAGWMPANRIYHADDHAVGHAWLDIHRMNPERAERLAPIRERMDFVIANPITDDLAFGKPPKTKGVHITDRWTWCDALYMAPPTLTRLHAITGDAKYLEFMDREFRYTYDLLWDKDERLFYRDSSFLGKETPGGKKIFWSRGNGWVYGGLALLLEDLPKSHPTRPFYENLFKEMTTAVLAAQQPDGLWRPSLLDPDHIPVGETSGSGFYTFGLAWGVNHGLLDRATHWPAAVRGWNGLLTRVRDDGYVGYVQPIGAAPDKLDADSRQDYGTGAFLLAGSEILHGAGGAATTQPAELLAAAEKILADDLAPRAFARLVPERKDDIAWENDKVAFRTYGPALRESTEDSGIDAWTKKVPYPILDKWYQLDLKKGISYHQDHGEGMDAYAVGNTRGCGGLGLWADGKIITSNAYVEADILWTSPDLAELRLTYQYPIKIGGRPLIEYRVIRLRRGERFFDVTAVFSDRRGWRFRGNNSPPAVELPHEVFAGLVTQSKDAPVTLAPEKGFISIHEPFPGGDLGTAVLADPARVVRTKRVPAADPAGKHQQILMVLRPDENGRYQYRAGFAWAGDGEITSADQWLQYLEQQDHSPK